MTQYNYPLDLDEPEVLMLHDGLLLMIKHCDEQMKNRPKAPLTFFDMACR